MYVLSVFTPAYASAAEKQLIKRFKKHPCNNNKAGGGETIKQSDQTVPIFMYMVCSSNADDPADADVYEEFVASCVSQGDDAASDSTDSS